ncbi:MAG: RNB domain-containing ribonuclease [Myxococcota bacterium]|nr:RNB domain-containing ribonuclease [Myxococcota bacterium]
MSTHARFVGRVCRNLDAGLGRVPARARLEVERCFAPTPDRVIVSATGTIPPGTWVMVESDGLASPVAHPGTARAKIYDLSARRQLDPVHTEACMAEALKLAADPGIDDPTLVELRHLPFVTIDEETSRDLDQALCIQRDGDRLVVWYAIADAAWFVRPGSALFDEALVRGATLYMPGLVVPMLPRILSEGIVSLNPSVDRRALVFRMVVGPDGALMDAEILQGRIHSRAKLTYDGVNDWLYADCPLDIDDETAASLRLLEVVGRLRIQHAEERDVVRLRRIESAVSMGSGAGLRFVAFADARNDVERYNEQISLLCNMVGARYLMADTPDHIQPIYRVHPPPSVGRLDALRDRIRRILAGRALDPALWEWGEQSLASYLNGLPRGGEAGRLAHAIHRQAMMINGRSSFTSVPGTHHGVGADAYARFSAPMREIVGVYVHQQCIGKLAGAPPSAPAGDDAIRAQVIAASNRVRQLQRQLDHETNRMVIDQLFSEDLQFARAPWRAGTVMGLTRSKIHVQLDNPGIDVKLYRVHLEAWTGQTIRIDDGVRAVFERGGTLLQLGDPVVVQVLGRDGKRDRWQLVARRHITS